MALDDKSRARMKLENAVHSAFALGLPADEIKAEVAYHADELAAVEGPDTNDGEGRDGGE